MYAIRCALESALGPPGEDASWRDAGGRRVWIEMRGDEVMLRMGDSAGPRRATDAAAVPFLQITSPRQCDQAARLAAHFLER